MKKLYSLALMGLGFLASMSFGLSMNAQIVMNTDSVAMGQYYANEVYYSMKDGEISQYGRNTWDIAFRTKIMSSSIITNDGTGVVLWTYPKSDTSGWASVDTSGLYTWTRMFNDINDWENGAFSRNAKGHPDYGWGVYNDQTHDLAGDSIFIIKLRDGSFRKLLIQRKNSINNKYYFRVANLDGSGQTDNTFSCNDYIAKDFAGYSLETNLPVDYQPAKATWDIVFTKYMSIQPNGTPYSVTGVLNNDGAKTKNFHPVPLNYEDYGPGTWDSTRSYIGWDWKYLDTNYVYHITDSSVYFVKSSIGEVFKLVFSLFAGSGTGLIVFETGKAPVQGIVDNNPSFTVSVYPNPAAEQLHISTDRSVSGPAVAGLYDLSGRLVKQQPLVSGTEDITMDVSGLNSGIYLLRISSSEGTVGQKVIISH